MDYTNKTIKAYEEVANQYGKKRAGNLTDAVPFLERFSEIVNGSDVLEIGFGLGQAAEWFVHHGFTYTGIDPVDAFYEPLRTKFPEQTILKVSAQEADFPKESFNGIFAMASLLHLNNEDLKIALKKCAEWLKEGGILFVTIKEGQGELVRDDGRYFNFFTKESFLELAEDFELLEFSTNPAKSYNTGTENWLNFYLKKS